VAAIESRFRRKTDPRRLPGNSIRRGIPRVRKNRSAILLGGIGQPASYFCPA
jgi:hypothetical protein